MNNIFNEQDVRKFYNFFKHTKPTEIRVFDEVKYPNGQSVFVTTENEFVEKCRYYCEDEVSVYIGARDRSARGDKNVISSSFVFFEIDEHEEGDNKDSEKIKILKFLEENNIKVGMQGMSGGGWHFYVPHKLQEFANSEEALLYKEQSLNSFKKVFLDKGFDVDGAVFNLERVTRVIGTFNYKRDKISNIDYINNINLEENTQALIKLLKNYKVIPRKNDITYNFEDDDFIRNVKEKWIAPGREGLALSVAGYLRKEKKLGLKSTLSIVKKICEDCKDEEIESRLVAVKATFDKDEKEIIGISGLSKREIDLGIKNNIKNLILSRQEDMASEEITKLILEKYYIYTTRDDIKSEIWYYLDGIYVPNGRSLIKEITREILEDAYTAQRVNKVIVKIEADTQIEHDAFFKNESIEDIPIKNGILNIFTRNITPFSPERIFFNKLPIIYNKNSTCKNIEKFFSDVLKDKSDVKVMFELIGFCLMKEYRFEKSFMFIGNGRNGKGKTLSLIKRFLGVENCSSIPLAQINSGSTSVCELHGRLANIAGDLSNTDLKDTGMFKQITGRDLITAKRKYLNDLFFENYAKVIFACNELPKVYDLSDGFWSRWVLFEFPYKFVKQNEYNKLSIKGNHKLMDESIIDKISTDEELSGLLNIALDGLKRIIDNKGFSYSKGTNEVKDLWIRKSDSFTAFCIDCIEEDLNGKVLKKQIRKEFGKYCRNNKIPGASDMAIKIVLENKFGAYDSQGSFGDRVWEGIKLK